MWRKMNISYILILFFPCVQGKILLTSNAMFYPKSEWHEWQPFSAYVRNLHLPLTPSPSTKTQSAPERFNFARGINNIGVRQGAAAKPVKIRRRVFIWNVRAAPLSCNFSDASNSHLHHQRSQKTIMARISLRCRRRNQFWHTLVQMCLYREQNVQMQNLSHVLMNRTNLANLMTNDAAI
jgi:hypothetical protein